MIEEIELSDDAMGELGFHPLCTAFPAMQDDEYDELVKSMETNGFLASDPIVLTEGEPGVFSILDGRNRHLAAIDAGVELVTEDFRLFTGKDPAAFVLAKNLDRRHLTTGQKAAIAAKIATYSVGDNQFSEGATRKDAAIKVGTSTKSISRYKKVAEISPMTSAMVDSGEISLNEAVRRVDAMSDTPSSNGDPSSSGVKQGDRGTSTDPTSEAEDGHGRDDSPRLHTIDPDCGLSDIQITVVNIKNDYTSRSLDGPTLDEMLLKAVTAGFELGRNA